MTENETRVATLAYLMSKLAIMSSFSFPELRKYCLGIILNYHIFLAFFRENTVSTFSANFISVVKLLFIGAGINLSTSA